MIGPRLIEIAVLTEQDAIRIDRMVERLDDLGLRECARELRAVSVGLKSSSGLLRVAAKEIQESDPELIERIMARLRRHKVSA